MRLEKQSSRCQNYTLLTSNKAEIRSLQPPHLNLCLSAHPFYTTDSGCNLHSPWGFIYETTDVLSVRISTCCCSSCGWKSFRAKKTASSSRRFMCHRLWDSSYSPKAGIPSHTTPQPWVDCIRRDHHARRYQAQGNSPAEEIWVASELRCGRDTQTSRSPRCSRDSRFQP